MTTTQLHRDAEPTASASYRIGDTYLDLLADWLPLHDVFHAHYSECAMRAPEGAARVACVVSRMRSGELSIAVDGVGGTELLEIALAMMHPIRHMQRYVEVDDSTSPRRVLVDTEEPDRPFMTGHGSHLVVDTARATPLFIADLIVGTVQQRQAALAFAHAASFGIGGSGALLVGPSGSGKSTLALGLGARGHVVLGDDVAAIRLSNGELLPNRRSAGIREGPKDATLHAALTTCRRATERLPNGRIRSLVRIGDVAPEAPTSPLPLSRVLVLAGFARIAQVHACAPGPALRDALTPIAHEETVRASWGPSRGRQIVRFLALTALLSTVPCYLLEVGQPEDTIRAVEHAMEAL